MRAQQAPQVGVDVPMTIGILDRPMCGAWQWPPSTPFLPDRRSRDGRRRGVLLTAGPARDLPHHRPQGPFGLPQQRHRAALPLAAAAGATTAPASTEAQGELLAKHKAARGRHGGARHRRVPEERRRRPRRHRPPVLRDLDRLPHPRPERPADPRDWESRRSAAGWTSSAWAATPG